MDINIKDYPEALAAIEDREPVPKPAGQKPTLARKRRERSGKRTFRNRRKAWMGYEDRNPIKDREALSQIRTLLAGMCKRTIKGRQWGLLTGKAEKIARALLDYFMNKRTGQCDPSYKRICEVVGTCNQTIADALEALEKALILVVIHRVVRRRVEGIEEPLVERASNAYLFRSPSRAALPKAVEAARNMAPLDRAQPRNYAALAAEMKAASQDNLDTSRSQRVSSLKSFLVPSTSGPMTLSPTAQGIFNRPYRMK